MPDDSDQFKRSLLRMLQTGTFQEIVGCAPGERAEVEFHVTRIYRVQLTRQRIIMQERDVEMVRRQIGGRWKPLRHTTCSRGRIVMDRASGSILESPSLGVARPSRQVQKRREARRKSTVLSSDA